MDPFSAYAASWAAGKLTSALSPRKSGAAQGRTDATLGQLGGYERSYQDLANRGRDSMSLYSPQLDTAVGDYTDYLKRDYGTDAQDATDIARATEGVSMDARRAGARVARSLPMDSEATGAQAGAQTAIEDRRLADTAQVRARVMDERIKRREQSKAALVDLLARQVMQGQSQRTTGLGAGAGITGQRLQVDLGREGQATQMDAGQDQGWQALIGEIARAEEARRYGAQR